jgi:hypothetical protein
MTGTKEQVLAAFEVVVATGQTIRELGTVPSGELYARVMDKLSIEAYGNIIATLKRAGMVEESGNVLTWIGPR